MRALVVGASGQVGHALSRALAARGDEVVGTYGRIPFAGGAALDLADDAACRALVLEVRPAWVLCAAGMTRVDECETDPGRAFAVNRDGPRALAEAAREVDAGIVYFSTEYVFDGAGGPYAEDDPPRPISGYGRSKLAGEEAIRASGARAVIVRTTVVYGDEPQGKNFVFQLLRAARAGTTMRVPRDQRSSPTYVVDLAHATLEIVDRGLAGTWHVAGPEVMDRASFGRIACEVFGLPPATVAPVTTAELAQAAPRPLDAGLRVDRARGALETALRGPREGLSAMRAAMSREGRLT